LRRNEGLPRVTFPEFDPVLVHIGPIAIRWYALAYVAGILLGWRYCVSLVRSPKLWGSRQPTLSAMQIDDLVLWVTAGIIVGGRLGSVLFYDLQNTIERPLGALEIWKGGMSFHGGLIGVTVALVGYSLAQKISLLRLADLIAPCVPFGLFFGRLANFVNGELWGRPTDVPWAVVFCNHHIQEQFGRCPAGMLPRHPSQIYEALLEGVVLFLILRWATHGRRWLQRRGVVAGLFLLCYGVFRILLENVRNPDEGLEHLPLGLTMGMYLSIPMLLAGVWLIWRGLKEPVAVDAPAEAPARAE
jgi:phosphatidylglycerol:prolipoprotein diacylglycerol transferase